MPSPQKKERLAPQPQPQTGQYIPQSAAYYSEETSCQIVGNSVKGRFHVNTGSPVKATRSLGRTQSLPDAFATAPIWRTAQDDIEAAAEEVSLYGQRELRPMYDTFGGEIGSPTPSLSPSRTLTSTQTSFNEDFTQNAPLTDFGDIFMKDGEDDTFMAGPSSRIHPRQESVSPVKGKRKKRKTGSSSSTEENESDCSDTDVEIDQCDLDEFSQQSASTITGLGQHMQGRELKAAPNRFKGSRKLGLRPTQSLPAGEFSL